MSTLFRIRSGQLAEAPIPEGGRAVRIDAGEQPVALPAAAGGIAFLAEKVTAVRLVAETATPWATWHLAPSWHGRSGAVPAGSSLGGLAALHSDTVLIRLDGGLAWTIGTAHHEAWHIAEQYLDASEIAVVDAAVARGRPYPAGYYDSAIERRARAFEAWAMAGEETGAPLVLPARPETAVFELVRSGRLAVRMARRGLIPASRMTPDLRARLAAGEGAPRPAWDAARALGALAALVVLLAAARALPPQAWGPLLLAAGIAAAIYAMLPDRRPRAAAPADETPTISKLGPAAPAAPATGISMAPRAARPAA